MAMFQRRHYQYIADTIASIDDVDVREAAIVVFMRALKRDNPRFKADRFSAHVQKALEARQ